MAKQKYWFKRRRYGYGWIPSTWQGWLVLAMYMAVIVIGSIFINPEGEEMAKTFIYLVYVFISTFVLLFITYRKGPKPKWRSGRTPQDNPEEDF